MIWVIIYLLFSYLIVGLFLRQIKDDTDDELDYMMKGGIFIASPFVAPGLIFVGLCFLVGKVFS